jgi:hypothetical protein
VHRSRVRQRPTHPVDVRPLPARPNAPMALLDRSRQCHSSDDGEDRGSGNSPARHVRSHGLARQPKAAPSRTPITPRTIAPACIRSSCCRRQISHRSPRTRSFFQLFRRSVFRGASGNLTQSMKAPHALQSTRANCGLPWSKTDSNFPPILPQRLQLAAASSAVMVSRRNSMPARWSETRVLASHPPRDDGNDQG